MKDDILKHLHDIREAALAISRFVNGKTFDDYMHDELLRPNFSFKKKSPPYQRGLGGCIKRNTKEDKNF
jgi:hypothetical protein